MILPDDAIMLLAAEAEKADDHLRCAAAILHADRDLRVPPLIDAMIGTAECVGKLKAILRVAIEEHELAGTQTGHC